MFLFQEEETRTDDQQRKSNIYAHLPEWTFDFGLSIIYYVLSS